MLILSKNIFTETSRVGLAKYLSTLTQPSWHINLNITMGIWKFIILLFLLFWKAKNLQNKSFKNSFKMILYVSISHNVALNWKYFASQEILHRKQKRKLQKWKKGKTKKNFFRYSKFNLWFLITTHSHTSHGQMVYEAYRDTCTT